MSVQIEISGVAGSGKSTILHAIGKALKDAGLNVTCIDDFGEITPIGFVFDPEDLDSRLINITTVLK